MFLVRRKKTREKKSEGIIVIQKTTEKKNKTEKSPVHEGTPKTIYKTKKRILWFGSTIN